MRPNVFISPAINEHNLYADPLMYPMAMLVDSAYANRTDLLIGKDNVVLAQQNLVLQKALAVPDLTAGFNADRHGSYYTDFNSVSLGIDVPLFNRNQGNIKNARFMVDYSNTELQLLHKTTEEQVYRGLQKALDADKLYKSIDPEFSKNFDRLAQAMLDNYAKRNVNLLTFLTFYDSYKQNVVQFNSILFNKINALENINFLTGTNFFNK